MEVDELGHYVIAVMIRPVRELESRLKKIAATARHDRIAMGTMMRKLRYSASTGRS